MKISVIIPAKNEENNIGNCLTALTQLDASSIEIIVIDNGSDDRTVDIAKLYTDKVFIEPNLSISELRNFGAHIAHHDILAFIDADCIADKDWVNKIQHNFYNYNIGCTGSTPVVGSSKNRTSGL